MIRLVDPDAVPPPLLGAAISVVIRALEADEEARRLLAGADAPQAEA
jgi:hypothetical protein